MKCPYCNDQMQTGTITGDGRTKVRWCRDGEKIDVLTKALTQKGVIDAEYSLSAFKIPACYCDKCHKMIIDTGVGADTI